jgi:hypothetical protein
MPLLAPVTIAVFPSNNFMYFVLVFFYMSKDMNSMFIFYSAAEKTLVFDIYIIFYIFEMNKTQISSYNMNNLRHTPVTHD